MNSWKSRSSRPVQSAGVVGLLAVAALLSAASRAEAQAELELDSFWDSQSVVAGTTTRINYELRNVGGEDAFDVEVTDILPQGLSAAGDPVFFTYVDDEDQGHCMLIGSEPDEISCRPAGNVFQAPDPYVLPAGATVSWSVLVAVPPTLVPGRYTNIADISVGNANFSLTMFGGDIDVTTEADLRIQVFSYDEVLATGEEGHIAIVVDNLGPSTAYNPVIRTTLTASDFVEANGCSLSVRTDGGLIDEFNCNFAMSTGIFDLGTFGANFLNPRIPDPDSPPDAEGDFGRIVITIDFTALAEVSINNTTDVVSDTFDPDMSNNLATTVFSFFEAADLALVMTEFGSTVSAPGCVLDPITLDAVTAGLDARYHITATNQPVPDAGGGITGAPGNAEATNVVVRSYVPEGARATAVRCEYDDGGLQVVPGTVGTPGDRNDPARCTIPFLPLGMSADMFIDFAVAPDFNIAHGDFLVHEATVASEEFDPNLANSVVVLSPGSEAGIPVSAFADMSVTKTPADLLIAAGETGTYTLEVINSGPSAASNVTLTDELTGDDGVHMIGVTVPELEPNICAIDPSGRNLICDLGILQPGESRTIWVEVSVDATVAAADNAALNTVSINADTPDCDDTNNTATANVDVDPYAGGFVSDLRITKYGKPDDIVAAGGVLTYTIIVDNYGPDAADGVTVRELIQSSGQFELLSIDSDRAATCNSDPAADGGNPFAVPPAAGGVASVSERYQAECVLDNPLEPVVAGGPIGAGRWVLTVRVRGNDAQSINNDAVCFSSSADPAPENNHASNEHDITEVANLAITKSANPFEAVQGEELTYTVTVTNNGPSAASNVVVEDRLPGEVLLINATPSQGTALTGTPGDVNDPTVANFGSIPAGANATLTILVAVPPNAPLIAIKNVALTHADQFDPDNSDNIVELFTQIVEPPPPEGQPVPAFPDLELFIPLFPAYPGPVCGINLCGAGMISMMPLLLLALRRSRRRWHRRIRDRR